MKTAKELNKLYVSYMMHNYRRETKLKMRQQGVFVSIPPEIFPRFCEKVEELVYLKNTAKARLELEYGKKFEPTYEYVEKHKLPLDRIMRLINHETGRLIDSYYEKHRILLNEIWKEEYELQNIQTND